jgi:hypothetical protein
MAQKEKNAKEDKAPRFALINAEDIWFPPTQKSQQHRIQSKECVNFRPIFGISFKKTHKLLHLQPPFPERNEKKSEQLKKI